MTYANAIGLDWIIMRKDLVIHVDHDVEHTLL